MNKLVELINVNVHFTHDNGDISSALDSVNLCIHQGKHIAIIGENGSGKSTLLRVLRGDIYPDQKNGGTVTWYEEGQAEHSPLVGRHMASIISPKIQEYYATQAWNVTCLEVIIAATTNDFILYREASQEEIERATKLAESLGSAHLLMHKISILSQGQLRIILLCRTLMRESALLLLDESMNGLDAKSEKLVLDALARLTMQKNSPTLVLTTHIFPLPDFINIRYEMQNGVLQTCKFSGTQQKLACNENIIIPNISSSTPTLVGIQLKASVEISTKAPIRTPFVNPTFYPQNGIEISLNNADVYVDHHHILHKINWHIFPHEQWSIEGENGSGKSTLLTVLLGFLPVALDGYIKRIIFNSANPQGSPLTELNTIKKHIRLVSDTLQTHYTYDDSVEKVVFSGFDGNIGVYKEITTSEQILLDASIHEAELTPLRHRNFRSLSTGQARRVLLARALINTPSLLLLDEPFSGLDEKSCTQLTYILEHQIAKGLQTILVSHHPQDFLPSTSHHAFMHNGVLSFNK